MKIERGSSMVEFAVIVPFLFVMFLGFVQYGLLYSTQISLRNVASVTIRYGTLGSPAPVASQVITFSRSVSPMLSPSKFVSGQTDEVVDGFDTSTGTSVPIRTVTLRYNAPVFLPWLVPGSSGGSKTITASTTMKKN